MSKKTIGWVIAGAIMFGCIIYITTNGVARAHSQVVATTAQDTNTNSIAAQKRPSSRAVVADSAVLPNTMTDGVGSRTSLGYGSVSDDVLYQRTCNPDYQGPVPGDGSNCLSDQGITVSGRGNVTGGGRNTGGGSTIGGGSGAAGGRNIGGGRDIGGGSLGGGRDIGGGHDIGGGMIGGGHDIGGGHF